MKMRFSSLDKDVIAAVSLIGKTADEQSLSAYLVGGFVRDMVLRRKNLDIDVAVEGNAVAFANFLAKKTSSDLTVYPQFGTATLKYPSGLIVDLATARKEKYPFPGALPVVSPGSIEEDLFRRDFTINAMAVCINKKRFGEVVDPYNGLCDATKKKIRILHEKSFIDDPTRIVRMVRFEQRFGFHLEPNSLRLLEEALRKKAFQAVKPPRYFEAFRKVFQEECPSRQIQRLCDLRALGFLKEDFTPDLKRMSLLARNIKQLSKDTFYKEKDWSTVYFLSFFDGAAKKDLEAFIEKFNFTRTEREGLLALLALPAVTRKLQKTSLRRSQVFETLNTLPLEIVYYLRARSLSVSQGKRLDVFLKKLRRVKLGITGNDLKRLGILPGKRMGILLHRVLLEKIDGKVKNRGDELQAVKKLFA